MEKERAGALGFIFPLGEWTLKTNPSPELRLLTQMRGSLVNYLSKWKGQVGVRAQACGAQCKSESRSPGSSAPLSITLLCRVGSDLVAKTRGWKRQSLSSPGEWERGEQLHLQKALKRTLPTPNFLSDALPSQGALTGSFRELTQKDRLLSTSFLVFLAKQALH